MEALVAIGLAGNIVQFVDFANELVTRAKELHHSARGALRENVELAVVNDDLKVLLYNIQRRQVHDASNSGTKSLGPAALSSLVAQCQAVGRELGDALAKVSVTSPVCRWQSYGKALRSVWSRKEIESIYSRLEHIRHQIQFGFVVEHREELKRLQGAQLQTSSLLDSVSRQMLKNVQAERDILADTEKNVIQEMQQLHGDCLDVVKGGFGSLQLSMTTVQASLNGIDAKLARADTPRRLTQETAVDADDFLETLKFRQMDYRHEQIEDAHAETFDHLLRREESAYPANKHEKKLGMLNSKLRDTFGDQNEIGHQADRLLARIRREGSCANGLNDWLAHGSSAFWIWGKPGCGKSTLMKLLINHKHYKDSIARWAHPSTPITVPIFLWRSGVQRQRSLLGLLQALLYHVLSQQRDAIDDLFSRGQQRDACRALYSQQNLKSTLWTLTEMKRAFKLLVERHTDLKIHLHLDGLDELDEQHTEVFWLFREILARPDMFKVLVAGRWMPEHDKLFRNAPRLAMHELTSLDTAVFALDTFLADEDMATAISRDPQDLFSIFQKILQRAQGVFLWAKLVVASLIDGASYAESSEELKARLLRIPDDLVKLYKQILDDIKPEYRSQVVFALLCSRETLSWGGSKLVQLLFPHFRITTYQLALADVYDEKDPTWLAKYLVKPRREHIKMASRFKEQLRRRGRHLFDFSDAQRDSRDPLNEWSVSLAHATVTDFLRHEDMAEYLQQCVPNRPPCELAAFAATIPVRSSGLGNYDNEAQEDDFIDGMEARMFMFDQFQCTRQHYLRYLEERCALVPKGSIENFIRQHQQCYCDYDYHYTSFETPNTIWLIPDGESWIVKSYQSGAIGEMSRSSWGTMVLAAETHNITLVKRMFPSQAQGLSDEQKMQFLHFILFRPLCVERPEDEERPPLFGEMLRTFLPALYTDTKGPAQRLWCKFIEWMRLLPAWVMLDRPDSWRFSTYSMWGSEEIVQTLVEFGADPHTVSPNMPLGCGRGDMSALRVFRMVRDWLEENPTLKMICTDSVGSLKRSIELLQSYGVQDMCVLNYGADEPVEEQWVGDLRKAGLVKAMEYERALACDPENEGNHPAFADARRGARERPASFHSVYGTRRNLGPVMPKVSDFSIHQRL